MSKSPEPEVLENMSEDMVRLERELYCSQYELKLLAGQVTGRGLERWIPGFTPLAIEREHLQRYEFACQYTAGRRVLDVACGTGRGSRLVAEDGRASSVCGVDLDGDAIRYAQLRNASSKLTFTVGDGLRLGFQDEFDVILCFETIEHVKAPEQLLRNLALALRNGGVLLISTPVSELPMDQCPSNPHHVQEWNCVAFRELLEREFSVKAMFLQYYPIFRPSLLRRVFTRLRLAPANVDGKQSQGPIWKECSVSDRIADLPANPWRGYQIYACSPRRALAEGCSSSAGETDSRSCESGHAVQTDAA